jgi:hypothetical protein
MPMLEKVGADPDFRPANAMLHQPTLEESSFELMQRVGEDAMPLFDPITVSAEADWGNPEEAPFEDPDGLIALPAAVSKVLHSILPSRGWPTLRSYAARQAA